MTTPTPVYSFIVVSPLLFLFTCIIIYVYCYMLSLWFDLCCCYEESLPGKQSYFYWVIL